MVIKEGIKHFSELEPNSITSDVLEYIERELPFFTDSDEYVNILASKKNENQHSQAFCVYMTNKCKSKFCFQRENSQVANRSIDIGIYKGSNLFFTMEAKVLPTPKNPQRKEHEYVYGKGGGIQRFKDEHHGTDNNDKLIEVNGLIGYLKEKNYDYWFHKINQWIVDASWDKSEQLDKIYIKSIGRFKSVHSRVNKTKVVLHHFWIIVS